MSKAKIVILSVGAFVGALILIFIIGLYSLGYFQFFAPKMENVRRGVFESTKSYMHGVQQDLGKYYNEYEKSDEAGKEVIRKTIQMRFAEVDANKLQSPQLRAFLEKTRGY